MESNTVTNYVRIARRALAVTSVALLTLAILNIVYIIHLFLVQGVSWYLLFGTSLELIFSTYISYKLLKRYKLLQRFYELDKRTLGVCIVDGLRAAYLGPYAVTSFLLIMAVLLLLINVLHIYYSSILVLPPLAMLTIYGGIKIHRRIQSIVSDLGLDI